MTSDKTADHIHLRPMKMSDLDEVVSIDLASFPTPWPKEAFLYELQQRRNSICRVAVLKTEDNVSELAGTVVIWVNGENAHIGTLAVKPGHRHRGIGQHLLANSLLECVQRGVKRVTLEVRAGNKKAQQLYHKFGFLQIGLREDYYKDTHEDALLMALAPLNAEKLAELANCG